MATAVKICSNALLRLGAQPINSFDEAENEGLDRARIAANLWPSVRDDLLRSHPWNCAVKRVQLAPLTAAPAFDWAYQFAMPTDWLRTLSVGEYEGAISEWKQEGNRILFDANILPLRYIARIEPDEFDPMLEQCAELSMAYAMAYPLTKSAALRDSLMMELKERLRKARSVNGQEDTAEQFVTDEVFSARMGLSVTDRSGR